MPIEAAGRRVNGRRCRDGTGPRPSWFDHDGWSRQPGGDAGPNDAPAAAVVVRRRVEVRVGWCSWGRQESSALGHDRLRSPLPARTSATLLDPESCARADVGSAAPHHTIRRSAMTRAPGLRADMSSACLGRRFSSLGIARRPAHPHRGPLDPDVFKSALPPGARGCALNRRHARYGRLDDIAAMKPRCFP